MFDHGVGREEIAFATQTYFQIYSPDKLLEKLEAKMKMKGWELIWTPPPVHANFSAGQAVVAAR